MGHVLLPEGGLSSSKSTQAVAHTRVLLALHEHNSWPSQDLRQRPGRRDGVPDDLLSGCPRGGRDVHRAHQVRADLRLAGAVGHNWFPMIVNSDERQWTWMDEGATRSCSTSPSAWEEDSSWFGAAGHGRVHVERRAGADHDELGVEPAVRQQRLRQARRRSERPARDGDGPRGSSTSRSRRAAALGLQAPRARGQPRTLEDASASTSTGSGAAGSTRRTTPCTSR